MRHSCLHCNYFTNSKFNFDKHVMTKKHNDNLRKATREKLKPIINKPAQNSNPKLQLNSSGKPMKICRYCGSTYVNQSSLTRHTHHCAKKREMMNATTDEITKLKHENEKLLSDLHHKNDMVKTLQETLEYERIKEKSHMSASNYLSVTYNNVPPLEAFNDFSIFEPEFVNRLGSNQEELKQIEDDDIFAEDVDPNSQIKNEFQTELLDMLLSAQKNKEFPEFIGRCLVSYYKKQNPSEQQIWNSDDERLTYFIRKNLRWAIDKRGVKTGTLIIEPVLDYLTNIIRKFVTSDPPSGRNVSCSTIIMDNKRRLHALEILQDVESGQTLQLILKYMAPHLYLDKALKHVNKPKLLLE